MSIAYTGNCSSGEIYATSLTTSSINVTSGNLLILAIGMYKYVAATTDFSDSRGNSWTRRGYKTDSGGSSVALFTAIAKDSGAMTITIDPPGTDVYYMTAACAEFSGVSSESPDNVSAGGTASSNDVHAGNVTLSATGLVVGAFQNVDDDVTVTADGNWTGTPYKNNHGSSYPGLALSYRLTGSGTYDDGWSLSGSRLWSAISASWLGSAAAGATASVSETLNFAEALD